MKRAWLALAVAVAAAGGVIGGHAVSAVPGLRNLLGHWVGRGALVAMRGNAGIYEGDIERQVAEIEWRRGVAADGDEASARREVILEAAARNEANRTIAPCAADPREFGALHGQFAAEELWRKALHASALNERRLREWLGQSLRLRRWIEQSIAKEAAVTDDECRDYFEKHHAAFVRPLRFRVAHLFLAARDEMPPEMIETKLKTIRELSERLKGGWKFDDLVPLFSEDEATRNRAGDLGYVSRFRMPVEFVAAAEQLRVGQVSDPVRTRIGFHLIRLIEMKSPQQMTLAEARAEIAAELGNARRVAAVNERLSPADLAR